MDRLSDPSSDFEVVRRVLRGARRPFEGLEIIKLLSLLLGDRDIVINRNGFRVQCAWTRRTHSYLSSLAPAAVCALLEAVGGGELAVGSRLTLSEEAVQSLTRGLRKGAFWLWLEEEEDAVRIAIRACDAAQPPPDDPESLPLWRPSPQAWLYLAAACDCPHCQHPSTMFRKLEGSVVCRSCGRSFTPPSDFFVGASERVESHEDVELGPVR